MKYNYIQIFAVYQESCDLNCKRKPAAEIIIVGITDRIWIYGPCLINESPSGSSFQSLGDGTTVDRKNRKVQYLSFSGR